MIKPVPPPSVERDQCFALRFSLMSEAAAHALERPERDADEAMRASWTVALAVDLHGYGRVYGK